MTLARSCRRSLFGRAVEPGARPGDDLRRVIGLGAGALQHEAVEGGELVRVEAQRPAAARLHRVQLGAGPVEDRHEVVADDGHAAGGEVAQRLTVIVEERLQIALAELDRLGHRQALHHTPAQPKRGVALDQRLAPLDLVRRPDHAIRDLVQRRDDAGGPGLPRIGELDHIVGAEPAPGLFHEPFPSPRTSAPGERTGRLACRSAGPTITRRRRRAAPSRSVRGGSRRGRRRPVRPWRRRSG